MGGDYGIQRFVGNFGAIIFAPLGGHIIDITSDVEDEAGTFSYSAIIYIYVALKLLAAVMIMMIQLDFKPPGKHCKLLNNLNYYYILLAKHRNGAFG